MTAPASGTDRTTAAMTAVFAALFVYSAVVLFASWGFMLAMLTVVVVAQHRAGWHRELPPQLGHLHVWITLAFAVGASAWKTWLVHRGGSDTGGIGNRLQHLSWSAAMVAILAPFLFRLWRDRARWEGVVLAVGVVGVVGIAVEVLEYTTHRAGYRLNARQAVADYGDTIADFVMNTAGSALGAWVGVRLTTAPVARPPT